jgi:hypothetical protein
LIRTKDDFLDGSRVPLLPSCHHHWVETYQPSKQRINVHVLRYVIFNKLLMHTLCICWLLIRKRLLLRLQHLSIDCPVSEGYVSNAVFVLLKVNLLELVQSLVIDRFGQLNFYIAEVYLFVHHSLLLFLLFFLSFL